MADQILSKTLSKLGIHIVHASTWN